MKRIVLLLAALAASATAAPPRRGVVPVAVDWSRTVRRTAEGNFIQGNPAARVKLVEYLSLTCPHCAVFEREAIPPLTATYIRTGRVSYEVRHAIRDPFDMAATILARCAGPAGFFAVVPAVYAEQAAWLDKGGAWADTKPQLDGLKPEQALPRIAAGAGLDDLFRRHGLAAPRQAACFAAADEEQRLAKASDAIWQSPGFPGTPAFDINGQRAGNVRTWADLDAQLAAALNDRDTDEDIMIKLRLPAAGLLLPLALIACSKKAPDATAAPSGPVATVAPPAGQDWAETVSSTSDGGTRMGNPDAPVKLVEYASLTCPHCRDFTAEAAEPLRNKYIRTGKVSWEYRPFLLNGLDTAAFLLARCQGPAPFFKLTEQTYADQVNWVGKYTKMTPAEQTALGAMDPAVQFKKMAEASGLDGFYRARGLPQAKADQCLADVKAAEDLVRIRDHATNDLNVTGTPSFFINGTIQDQVYTWDLLDKNLAKAVG